MRKLSIVAITLLAFSACKKDHELTGCDAAVCTTSYRSVQVQVTYAGPTKAELDEVYTVNSQTGERVDLNQNLGAGYYIVLDDSYKQKLANSTATFHLMGKRDNAVVMDEPFTISADCCHIKKESGKDIVVIR